jgi:FtsP/CotA-like multicopper oxidase with cupredoxin domain
MGMPINAVDPVTGIPVTFPGGPLEVLVNNTKWDGKRVNGIEQNEEGMWMYTFETRADFTLDSKGNNYLSELPKEGETELWEIINLTADAHPIHLHLVQFQLLNRQAFDVPKYDAAYAASFPGGGFDHMTGQPYLPGQYIPAFGPPMSYGTDAVVGGNPDVNALNAKKRPLYLQGVPKPPGAHEAGWKDTTIMFPGQVTRILVRWAPTDFPANTPPAEANFPFDPNGGNSFVWHCHIVDHEDNEMMRPDEVIPNPVARSYVKGEDY